MSNCVVGSGGSRLPRGIIAEHGARHNDRRLAESIYRAAVASGIMERIAYQDTIAEAG